MSHDTAPLRAAYAALLDAAATVADADHVPAPPPGEWDADQILGHVSLVTAEAIAAAARVAAGALTTFDNRPSLDTWTIGRVVERAGADLRERVRAQGEVLCAFGGAALDDAELDTPLPTLFVSHDELGFEGPLALRDVLDGIAQQELPGHTAQLLALLPERAPAAT